MTLSNLEAEKAPQEILSRCVTLALDKKARDVVSLDMAGLTLICDYFLIMTATSTRQAQALCDELELVLKAQGCPPLRVEGYRDSRWILLDLGCVVVHIFLEEERQFYDLERLWGQAPKTEY